MSYWISLCFLFVAVQVCAKPNEENVNDRCVELRCQGEGYECIDDQCYCSDGYIPNQFHSRCIRCPGLGEKCYRSCCSTAIGNGTLACWQGVCQLCYDSHGHWICRDTVDSIVLISGTQIAMASALVLGILATFLLLYKLCAATDLRPMGNGSGCESRMSIGSLQIYVEERLRDAPPRYSRTAPSGTAVIPATVFINAGFLHDVPPPPYTPQKVEDNNNTVHI